MSKTRASAGVFAHAADVASRTNASNFDPRQMRARPVGGHVKRAIDVALALLALMLLSPLFVLVAVLVRVVLGRPVLVGERHVGFGGQVFTAYTFDTSPTRQARKLVGDSAIVTCLASLRDTHLDRLPRLFSVLRGDMSFVGPQPVTLDPFDRGGYCTQDYFMARPGLVGLHPSGWAGKFSYGRRAALDRYYVRRWSVWLDFALLAKAMAAVRDFNDRA